MRADEPSAVNLLRTNYPGRAGRFAHALGNRAELAMPALLTAARAMPARDVELRCAARGEGFGERRVLPARLEEALDGGERWWLMLRNPGCLPDYAALLDDLIAAIAPVVAPITGPLLRPQLFLFVSAPGSHTPVHIDAEYNLFFQLAGAKRFAVGAAETVRRDEHLRLHRGGDNLLEPRAAIADGATQFALAPGDGLFVPYKAPHWIDVAGESPSVSLSLTWASRWSLEQEAAWRAIGRLALPGAPPPWPRRARARAGIGRLLDRVARA